MSERVPGALCGAKFGASWIDSGTSCRWRSAPSAPSGIGATPTTTITTPGLPTLMQHDPYGANYNTSERHAVPAIAVQKFEGSGSDAARQFAPGFGTMLQTDLTKVPGKFQPVVVEWERRGDIAAEVKLSKSPMVDPATRIKSGQWIYPDVFVKGRVSMTADQSSTSWDVRMVDSDTGEIVATDRGTALGTKVLESTAGIAERLVKQLEAYWQKKQRRTKLGDQSPRRPGKRTKPGKPGHRPLVA
jgi:hypothetical protein